MKKLMFLLVFCILSISGAWAQKTFKGKIIGPDGLGLPGVNVVEKANPVNGAATDIDGNWTLTVPSENTILELTAIGMKPIEIAAKNALNLKMESDAQVLDEVMVVAYGTAKKSTFTGSATAIKSEKLAAAKVESVDKALSGKVAGVRVSSKTGDPGASGEIQVRGIGSINGSTSPLYVVDGIPIVTGNYGARVSSNVLSSINPDDVASITVLKDAAAASLYGSRAANGVVIITTKKGKSGKTRFKLSASTGWSNMATNSYEPMSAKEFLEYQKAALEGYELNKQKAFMPDQPNYGDAKIISDAKKWAKENYLSKDWSYITDPNKEGANWRDEIYDGGAQSDVQFSANGGTEKTQFFASLGYNQVKGLVKHREFKRYSSLLNVSNKAKDWLELNFKSQISYSEQEGRGDQSNQKQGISTSSPLNMLFSSNPAEKVYNKDGSFNMGASFSDKIQNAIYSLSPSVSSVTNKTLRAMNSIGIKVKLTDELSFTTNDAIDYFKVKSFNYWGPNSIDGASVNGLGEIGQDEVTTITSSNIFKFNKTLNEVHNLAALAGIEMQSYKDSFLFLSAKDYSNDILVELSNGQGDAARSGVIENFMLSYLGNINYNYDNKYYLAASLRQDESSKLGKDNRKGIFWSLSGSWRFSRESFFKSNVITNGQIRASYGTNGTLPKNSYSYMGLYYFGGNYGDKPASYLDQLENNNLGWEKSQNLNIGLDVTLWERFRFGIEYFNKYTKDLLLDMPVSYLNGKDKVTKNAGEISNQGFDFEIHASDILKSELKWNSDFTLSTLKAKVEKLPGGDIISGDGDLYIYKEGENLNSFYLPTWVGVDKSSGLAQFLIDPTKEATKDNITNKYTEAGRGIQKSAFPTISGGLSNGISYKGLSLNFLITYQYGGNLFDYPGYFFTNAGLRNYSFNYSKELVNNYWTKKGDNSKYPRPILFDPYRSDKWSTRHILSTDYIRLKEVSLGYQLPQKWYKKYGISNIDFAFTINNLAYLYTATDNMELEVPLNGYRTVDTPMARTFLFSLNVGF